VGFKLRKLFIAVLSLAGVLAIYLLYAHISRTLPIGDDSGSEFAGSDIDSNAGGPDSKIGRVAGVGIAKLAKPKFLHRNKNKEVDREFGFEELLHEEKDRWEIEKPYLNIFAPNFTCYITADKGKARVESTVGRPTPKDATFTGNVVFHILPEGTSTVKESFLYLDDIEFLSDKTQFSTAGPVKFVSEETQMSGTGLELIFNDQLQRLEFLRIIDLDRLHIKSQGSATARSQPPNVEPPTPTTDNNAVLPVSTDSQKAQVSGQQGEGDYYKCVCSKNVVIDTPEQLVFADQQISINNIFWSRPSGNKSNEGKAADTNNVKAKDSPVTKRSD